MRNIMTGITVTGMGLALIVAVAGCGSSTPPGKVKKEGEKMSTDTMGGDKMDGGKKDKM